MSGICHARGSHYLSYIAPDVVVVNHVLAGGSMTKGFGSGRVETHLGHVRSRPSTLGPRMQLATVVKRFIICCSRGASTI